MYVCMSIDSSLLITATGRSRGRKDLVLKLSSKKISDIADLFTGSRWKIKAVNTLWEQSIRSLSYSGIYFHIPIPWDCIQRRGRRDKECTEYPMQSLRKCSLVLPVFCFFKLKNLGKKKCSSWAHFWLRICKENTKFGRACVCVYLW